MAPRAYWKGHLRLSLVTCPIELFPATSESEKTHFHQINKKTGHRLRQQMVDETTGKVVEKDDKGRGYELGKGRYVEIDQEELEAVEVESTHTVDIDAFVPAGEVDKRYLNKPYYVVPRGKAGAEAFCVIRDAMKDKDRIAIARIVMAHREHMLALEPLGKGLLGTYAYEMRDEKAYFADIATPRIARDMIKLAEHILDTKAAHFDPKRFNDRYETALRKLVKRKASGKKIEEPEPEEKPSNVVSLMEALRRSAGEGKRRARPRAASRKRPASSRRRKKAA
jgi:DNA end-binding protein Ku